MQILFDVRQQVDEASRGYKLSIENVLQSGFNLLRRAPSEFILFSLLGVLVFSNPITGILLGGPLTASYLHLAHLASLKQKITPDDFFRGFDKFVPLIKLNLLILVVFFLGLLMLIIPGIYFAISYIFAHIFVWFFDIEPTEAIKLSRKTVSGNFGQIFLLCLVLAGINLLGVLALGVGVLLTMPFSFCVLYAVFDDIIGISNS